MTAHQTVTLGDQKYTYESLYTLGGSELVKVHNAAAPKVGVEPTKRFSDKVAAVKRTWAVLQKIAEGATIASAPSEVKKAEAAVEAVTKVLDKVEVPAKPVKAAKVAKEKVARKPRGKRFVFPKGDELKPVREGTMRATLVKLLTREREGALTGATFEQCLAATWGQKAGMKPEIAEKTCYEAMRLLHYYCGYGMKHLDDTANPHIAIYF